MKNINRILNSVLLLCYAGLVLFSLKFLNHSSLTVSVFFIFLIVVGTLATFCAWKRFKLINNPNIENSDNLMLFVISSAFITIIFNGVSSSLMGHSQLLGRILCPIMILYFIVKPYKSNPRLILAISLSFIFSIFGWYGSS